MYNIVKNNTVFYIKHTITYPLMFNQLNNFGCEDPLMSVDGEPDFED